MNFLATENPPVGGPRHTGSMDQRIHFVTFATPDLDAARDFYRDGFAWAPLLDVPGEILFFQAGPGLVLGLYDAAQFAEDIGADPSSASVSGVTLSHNLESPAEVDAVVERAVAGGASLLTPGRYASFGGYHAHVKDPNGIVWEIAHNPGWNIANDGTVSLG